MYRHGPWRSCEELEFATLDWIDWSDQRRLFSSSDYVPLAEYETSGDSLLNPGGNSDSITEPSTKPGAVHAPIKLMR